MSKKMTKFTKERVEIVLELIRDGYFVVDACRGANIGRSTYYKWLSDFPDFNKAVCEATDLQWKYASQMVRRRRPRGYNRHLNRPSANYQSPNNLPFTMPDVDRKQAVDDVYEEWWARESFENAY